MFLLTATFLLLSGIASLTYQVVWVRLLGLSMGSTSASISTVLAAFFLGLALGSYLAERITRNRINDLKPYIALEIIIGLSGLALLPILLNLDAIMAATPALGATIPNKFAVTTALLLIPTVCMGATFPVMASILIRRKDEVGLRVSQLYSLNTAGAVLGAALAGFFFVPNWGLDGAVYIAFSFNLLIVVLAVYLNRKIELPPIEVSAAVPASATSVSAVEEAPLRGRALMVLFATGLVAIATEVGWTKYLSIFTGTTIYGFAAILTIFLTGIAAGSWAIKSHLERMQRPELWMAFGLVLLGGSLLLTRAGLTWIPPIYQAINHFPVEPWLKHGVKYAFVFMLLFPPTFLFGVLFPLNLKLYCGNLQGVRARIGKAYAVNTVASIFGSLMAGFWLIPYYGTDVLLTSMAIVLLLLPFLFVPALKTQLARVAITSVALIALLGSWLLPHLSYKDLISSVQYDEEAYTGKEPKYLFLKEGKAGVISMVTYDDRHVKLQNNGLNESFIDLEDENNVLLVESLLGLVPYLVHENPKSAFVVGFGGGITTKALTFTQLESIRVVELEPAVVEAGRAILGGKIPALEDPRVTLTLNDARNTLLTENTRYDIIAAQPSHPWLARAANVFTKNFFELVNSRLNEGGIYSQWVNLFHMDATTLKSLMRAFYEVFPHGMSFANLSTGDFIMYGSGSPLIFDFAQIEQRMSGTKIKAALNYYDIYSARDLMWYFSLSREEALAASMTVPANTDTNILSEVRLSAMDNDPPPEENPYDFLRGEYRFNLRPHFGADAVERIYDLGTFYLSEWNELEMAQHAADQLRDLDPIKARGIEYEKHWHRFEFDEADALFAQHPHWPDRTYIQQALSLADRGRYEEAAAVMPKVEMESLRRTLSARLLYERGHYDELIVLNAKYDAEKLWRLSALAKRDLTAAGAALHALAQHVSPELPQMRLLAGYYGAINDAPQLERMARLIIKQQDKEIVRIQTLLSEAVEAEQGSRSQDLLRRLDRLNPEASYKLKTLRAKVEKLAAAS
ncbi:MAG: fused MFS/spermidine synthase [Gammaproteobacteria bacterium]|nr:fused MFS/spermidine synthase [Gammaproteobacteria bacterium]